MHSLLFAETDCIQMSVTRGSSAVSDILLLLPLLKCHRSCISLEYGNAINFPNENIFQMTRLVFLAFKNIARFTGKLLFC